MNDAIRDYDWTRHDWDHGGSVNPACIPEWKAMAEKLIADPARYEVTTDGGWPRVGWREVLAVEMRRTWPYNHDVPSVLLSGWDGAHWHAVMSLNDIRERSPSAAERKP